MSRVIQMYCPICDRTTAHEIYTTNNFGERAGISRFFNALLTIGLSEINGYRVCECLNCGKKRPIGGNNGNLRFGM